jgi:hypothetical protein
MNRPFRAWLRKLGELRHAAFWKSYPAPPAPPPGANINATRFFSRQREIFQSVRRALFLAGHPAPPAPPPGANINATRFFSRQREIFQSVRRALFLSGHPAPPAPPPGANINATRFFSRQREIFQSVRRALFLSAGHPAPAQTVRIANITFRARRRRMARLYHRHAVFQNSYHVGTGAVVEVCGLQPLRLLGGLRTLCLMGGRTW